MDIELIVEKAEYRARILVDSVLHPWWEVGDWLAGVMFQGWSPDAPDVVFDRLMKEREDRKFAARLKEKGG